MTELQPRDRAIFYFSGDGSDESDPLGDSLGFLLPVDAGGDDVAATSVSLADISKATDNAAAQYFTVLLDACFAGGGKSVGDRRLGRKDLQEKSLTGGIVFGPGKISLYSSRDNQVSLESSEHQNDYFTHHRLAAWNRGLRDADDVYDHVYAAVTEETNHRQSPRRDYDQTEGAAATY